MMMLEELVSPSTKVKEEEDSAINLINLNNRSERNQNFEGRVDIPSLPPILKRNTTADIEAQIDECLSHTYAKHILEDNEPFAAQPDLKLNHYYYLNPPDDSAGREPLHMKQIMKEISKDLPKQLEVHARGSMFVRFDEESPQYIRAALTGVEGTPYASGVFLFDIFLPADYPAVPCHCIHVTPNANLVRANNGPGGFSPNLHSDTGKVCLSLLGTWDGPGWSSSSNVYQVLSTILYMILGAKHPYYMEPGYGGWEGTAPLSLDDDYDKHRVIEYDEEVKLFNAKLCVLAPLLQPPVGFEAIVRAHLFEKRKLIVATLKRWANKGSEQLNASLTPIIAEIEEAYRERMTLQYAEEDYRESQQLVSFIEKKMIFLKTKVELWEAKEKGSAAVRAPKAWERYCMGPKLLAQAQKDLENKLKCVEALRQT